MSHKPEHPIRLVAHIDIALHRAIRVRAAELGISLREFVASALRAALEAKNTHA